MPRITISIPADLKRHLANVRIRKGLNISRVCQAALKREVQRLLQLPMELERMELLLSRLQHERRQTDDRWYLEGAQAARDWVEHDAPYARLRTLGQSAPDKRIELLLQDPPEALRELLQQTEKPEDFSQSSLLSGWASTIGIMWAVIEQNL